MFPRLFSRGVFLSGFCLREGVLQLHTNFKGNAVSTALYIGMLFVAVASFVFIITTSTLENPIDAINEDSMSDIVFYMSDGDEILNTMRLCDHANEGVIHTILPDEIGNNKFLCFQFKHVFFSVSVGGRLIYEPNVGENILYMNSTGTDWAVIPLEPEYAGQQLSISYKLAYEDYRGGIDMVSIGRPDGYLLSVIKDRLPAFLVCVSYVIIGFVLIVVNLITLKQINHDSSLLWLGLISLSVASYCLFDLNIIQIFITNHRLIQLGSMFALALIPVPTVMYSVTFFKFKYKIVSLLFVVVSAVNFAIQMLLTIFTELDYHYFIVIFHALIILAIIILASCIIHYIVNYVRAKKPFDFYVKAMTIGLLGIMSTGAVDVIRYWMTSNTSNNNAKYLRFGFLVFMCCFAASSSEKLINAFKTSMRANMIAKFAYEDGLTGLYNRTSYKEMLESIERDGITTGIVMMDVNNLKYVNDTFGHQDGDSMLLTASELIKKAFDKPGMKHYRIGGDEFVVLVQTGSIKDDSLGGVEKLRELCEDFNNSTDGNFKIVIATGFDAYVPSQRISVEDVVKSADVLMYANKKLLKQSCHMNGMVKA